METQPSMHERKPKRRARPRPLPPAVNAHNLALEKGRREDMKRDLLDLARLVPALAPVRRLSKTLVVKESLRHFKQQREMCLAAAEDVRDLVAENHRLIAQLNELRFLAGKPSTLASQPKPLTEGILQLMDVPNQVCGQFPAGFGDNWACETHEAKAQPTRSTTSAIEDAEPFASAGVIPWEVGPPIHGQAVDNHENATSFAHHYKFPLPIEMGARHSLDFVSAPDTPIDFSHEASQEELISTRGQLECYMPLNFGEYPIEPLEPTSINIPASMWMHGVNMSPIAQYIPLGDTGPLDVTYNSAYTPQ
ncbi:uncharacterized protein N7482_006535 [Penicillium canariense]|uniref:BHLH domain-containing protein n=1 Tax=Penicillium canariense TaxID=189055 RepID=A0A9W9HXS4_9EURO|nr:uncharacterized protein N7482_006535 [Penicillium canariense]KAJ5159531.1 hypothetical protein N7482_006535 [Penicillium canariense]